MSKAAATATKSLATKKQTTLASRRFEILDALAN